MTQAQQPEALRLAHALGGGKLIDDSTEWADTLHAAAAELRRQHARIEALEAAQTQRVPLSVEAIADIAERFEATDPTDSFWVEVCRAFEGAVPQWDGVIKPSDFIVNTFRSGSSGWVPKPDNCVRITHRPTGFFEEESAMRSVHANKAAAWQRLSDRLESLAVAPKPSREVQHEH